MKKNLKQVIATVAPALATAFGGPLAGMATRAVAGGLLGREDASLDEVEQALAAATPADLVRLKEIETRFKADLKAADVKLEQIAAEDRASARDRQARMKDWTPSVLGLAIIAGFFGVLGFIFTHGLPASGSEVLLIMVGALGTMTSQVGNYFFGSSVGSKTKEGIIAQMKGGAS